MTPQEARPLQEFLAQLTQVRGVEKDPDAGALIAEAMTKQPDAGYLLVQRSMLLNQALESAKATITQLQSELASRSTPASPGSSRFLDPASAWGRSASAPTAGSALLPSQNSPYAFQSSPQASPQASPQTSFQMNSQPGSTAAAQSLTPVQVPAKAGFFSGGGGFLGNVAATAAGVAGGAFLFQGIESMMGHHDGSNFLGQNAATGSNAGTPENTTVNNFYESDGSTKTSGTNAETTNSAENYEDNGIDDLGVNDDLGSADDMSSI